MNDMIDLMKIEINSGGGIFVTLEKYEKILDGWAAEENRKAEAAKSAGDERLKSICLMKASMLGDMLKVLGRVELSGRTGTLERIACQQQAEAEK